MAKGAPKTNNVDELLKLPGGCKDYLAKVFEMWQDNMRRSGECLSEKAH